MSELRLEDKVKIFIVNRLNLDIDPQDIEDTQPLFGEDAGSLGLDSIDGLELAAGIQNEFGFIIESDIDPAQFLTIEKITDFIRKNASDFLDEFDDYELD